MIADALRAEIELYAVRMRQSNPLFRLAEEGTLTKEHMTRYLANVHHLLLRTPIHLVRARDRARALDDAKLAEHYENKLTEEKGHNEWAEQDMKSMAPPSVAPESSTSPRGEVLRSIGELVTHNASIIDEDPSLYLAYILFAEYLIVLLGPEWLELLEERCGIPRSQMTAIGNHAELDRGHAEEAFEQIDLLVRDPRKLPRMRQVLVDTIALFDTFSAEVTGTRDSHDERSRERVSAS
jgi:hypothetical protein